MMGGLSQRKHKTTGRRSTEESKGGDLKEGRGGQRDQRMRGGVVVGGLYGTITTLFDIMKDSASGQGD